jgi:hypothetical protein
MVAGRSGARSALPIMTVMHVLSRRGAPALHDPSDYGHRTSTGSMGQSELDAALAEIRGVIQAAGVGPQGLLVLACDAEVGATTRVRRVTDVRLVGGGGTNMRVGIAAAEAARPRPDVAVVLTDGYTPWPDGPTRARLVAAIIGGDGVAQQVPDWATTVVVPAA